LGVLAGVNYRVKRLFWSRSHGVFVPNDSGQGQVCLPLQRSGWATGSREEQLPVLSLSNAHHPRVVTGLARMFHVEV
jgi:hypothetical protein